MKVNFIYSAFILFFANKSSAQDFNLISQSNSKSQYLAKLDKYSEISIELYSNGKFLYESHTDVGKWVSQGSWKITKNIIKLKSEFQEHLPIKVTYLKRTENTVTKSFEPIKDLAEREYLTGAIYINNDTTYCFGGDVECFGDYKKIDSIKIVVNGFNSKWEKVDTTKGIIQIIVPTDIDLKNHHYLNMTFKKQKGKLRLLGE